MNKKNINQLHIEFIKECRYVRKLSESSIRGYEACFNLLTKIMPDISLTNLSSETIGRFFEKLEKRKRVVGRGDVKSGIKKSTVATYWSKLAETLLPVATAFESGTFRRQIRSKCSVGTPAP